MKWRLALAATVVAAVAAGTTYATTSLTSSTSATNTIQACVKDNGDVRIVASAAQCRTPEHAISWNVVGPKGDTGATGATGARGPAGAEGLSVQSAALAAGDANCPFGGSSFTIGPAPATFACNGAPGAPGRDGADGKDGTSVTSIGGLNGLSCTSGGQAGTVVVGSGAGGAITLTCQVAGGGGGTGGGNTSCDGTGQPYPNGSSVCDNGAWILVCMNGFADADGQLANGCEVDLMTDVNNCGTVGNVAQLPNAITGCVEGRAVILACDPDFTDLDGNPANGCEAALGACPHPNGLGGTYSDCGDPLGTPGNESTYSLFMATLAAQSWSATLDPSVGCTDGGSAVAAVNGTQTAVWTFSGPNAGHVRVANTGAFCPTSTDPVWR